jgi:GH35 family endo-1,4-beta-xylanase
VSSLVFFEGYKLQEWTDVPSIFFVPGVPVDAIGFQCHFTLGQVPDTLQENLQRFADLDLDVAITELDINIGGPPNATSLAQQAKDFATVVTACLQVKRCVSIVSLV